MQAPPEKKIGEDGLPIPPYAVYNIGNNHPENLLEFVDILQQELIRAGVLPEDLILTVIRNWYRCSRVMCRLLMRIHLLWSVILDLSRVPICGPALENLRSGIRNFTCKNMHLRRGSFGLPLKINLVETSLLYKPYLLHHQDSYHNDWR